VSAATAGTALLLIEEYVEEGYEGSVSIATVGTRNSTPGTWMAVADFTTSRTGGEQWLQWSQCVVETDLGLYCNLWHAEFLLNGDYLSLEDLSLQEESYTGCDLKLFRVEEPGTLVDTLVGSPLWQSG